MPPKFSLHQGRRTVASRKIKQVWKPKEKPCPPPPWTELPRDIIANILHRLGAVEILETAQRVCTTWRSVCKDPSMWRVIDMHVDGYLDDMAYNLEIMCHHTVDRSQGHLAFINLEYFATDELLDYIAKRSGKLKGLRLAWCANLTNEGLIEGVKGFPELGELRIVRFVISSENLEKVGHYCPSLKSLAYNKLACPGMDDEDARVIARSMPELRHLQLLGNSLTNEGLEAILDGCPHLESLDIRRCCYVKLTEDIMKRCSTQIKWLLYDKHASCEFETIDGLPYEDIDPYYLYYNDHDISSDDYSRPDREKYPFDGNYCSFFS